MKKIISFGLALVLVLLCVACAGGNNSNDPSGNPNPNPGNPASGNPPGTVEQIVYVNMEDGDPGTLDPISSWSGARMVCLMQVYEKLGYYADEGDGITGVLMESYKQDGKEYTVTIYDYIKDSAGNPFTVDDIIWCIEKQAEAGTNSSAKKIDSMEKIDDYNLKITFKNNDLGQFQALCVDTYLCTRAAYEADENGMAINAVGTGPYLVDNYVSGSSVTLRKNPNYWQQADLCQEHAQQANVETIVFNIVTEAAQMVVGLETGTLDMSYVEFSNAKRFMEGGEDAGQFTTTIISGWGGQDIWCNMSDDSVMKDNPDLRKAIMYAIDRNAVIQAVYDGFAENPATYGTSRFPDVDPALKPEDYYGYNPELAKEYLDKAIAAGYDPNSTLVAVCDNRANAITGMDVIQAYLGQIGIKIEVQPLESATFQNTIDQSNGWDLCWKGKGATNYVVTIWNAMLNAYSYTEDGSHCFAFISDPELQRLLEAACNAETHSYETTNAVHYYLMDQAYQQRLFVEQKCMVSNNDKVMEVCVNKDTRIVPGACTYVWN